jgi:hypothetical protein
VQVVRIRTSTRPRLFSRVRNTRRSLRSRFRA